MNAGDSGATSQLGRITWLPARSLLPSKDDVALSPAQRPGSGGSLASRNDRFSQGGTMRQGSGATSLLGRIQHVRAANTADSGATSRLGRKTAAQDPGLGEKARRAEPSTCGNVGAPPCLKGRFSPKAGSCAEKGPISSSRGRISPKQGRCAKGAAQRLGLGEPPPDMRAEPSRGGSMRHHPRCNVPAWEGLTALRGKLG